VKLNELKNKRKALTLDTQYGEMKIEYCPAEYTGEIEGLIADGQDSPVAAIVKLLEQLVTTWDIEGEDGESLAVNEDTLQKLPLELLLVIVKGITEDGRPNAVSAPA